MGGDLSAIKGQTSEYVTTKQNVTGLFTPVFVVSPERGQYIVLENRVPSGNAAGIPVYAKFKDTNGDDLPANTEAVFAYKGNNDDEYRHVSTKLTNIQSYNVTTFGNQQSEDRIDQFKIDLDGTRFEVADVDKAALLLKSSTQIDPSKSMITIDGKAVESGAL